jgi:hypothetical protein
VKKSTGLFDILLQLLKYLMGAAKSMSFDIDTRWPDLGRNAALKARALSPLVLLT